MGNIKEINIKNRAYYFFNDMINIEDFDPNLLKIEKKSYKNINIHYIGYITMKNFNYVIIKCVKPMYLIISKVDGCIEGKNGNKYSILNSAELRFKIKTKKYLKKHTELWDGIENEIETINVNKEGEHGKDFMKIKFDTDDNLPLNKTLKLHNMTIIIRSVFEEDGKFYLQIYLDECLYEL